MKHINIIIAATFVVLGFLIAGSNIYAFSPSDESLLKETMANIQISGTVIDSSSKTPIENALIMILDPGDRELLFTDIYTNAFGKYEASLNSDYMGVDYGSSDLPNTYWLADCYPNPVSASTNQRVTIQYTIPGNILVTPELEVFNLLGKKVDHIFYLASSIYFYRLKFKNGHFSKSNKMVLTSGGMLKISLNQLFINPKEVKTNSGLNSELKKKTDDTYDVLFIVRKNGYAELEESITLYDGINNVNDFSLTQTVSPDSFFFDGMDSYNSTIWQKSDGAWGGHYECAFRPDFIRHDNSIMTITLENQANYGYYYTSGEYFTKKLYGYGRIEGRIKFSCTEPGTVASLFTYTDDWDGNPLSEIDIEILGKDPTVMWCSIHAPNHSWSDTVKLGFDSSQDFHTYGFDWTPTTVSWIVDGQVVQTGDGSILPANVPTRIVMNFWNGDYGWTGEFNYPGTPLTTEYDWIRYTPLIHFY